MRAHARTHLVQSAPPLFFAHERLESSALSSLPAAYRRPQNPQALGSRASAQSRASLWVCATKKRRRRVEHCASSPPLTRTECFVCRQIQRRILYVVLFLHEARNSGLVGRLCNSNRVKTKQSRRVLPPPPLSPPRRPTPEPTRKSRSRPIPREDEIRNKVYKRSLAVAGARWRRGLFVFGAHVKAAGPASGRRASDSPGSKLQPPSLCGAQPTATTYLSGQ